MTDEKILALYNARDEDAIRASEAAYGGYCRRVAYNILPSSEDAEECVADTWWQAWNAIPPAAPAVLRLFFARITRNLSLSRVRAMHALRRGGGEICAVLDELAECAAPDDTEGAVLMHELSEALSRFLADLPPRECGIFLRRYFYADTAAQIARRFAITEANVRVTLSRTRKKLQEYLIKEGFLP